MARFLVTRKVYDVLLGVYDPPSALDHSTEIEITGDKQVLAYWAEEWDSHIADVRGYFADRPGQLIEFNIDTDDIADLVARLPYDRLDAAHFGHRGKTDAV